MVRALPFDAFGTVVDRRASLAGEAVAEGGWDHALPSVEALSDRLVLESPP